MAYFFLGHPVEDAPRPDFLVSKWSDVKISVTGIKAVRICRNIVVFHDVVVVMVAVLTLHSDIINKRQIDAFKHVDHR